MEAYIDKLIRQNMNVALCDQIPASDVRTTQCLLAFLPTLCALQSDTPTRTKSKVLHREVTRVITPGTFIDERFLNPREANYLVSVVCSEPDQGTAGLVWLDISTGQLRTSSCAWSAIHGELSRIRPKEIILSLANVAKVPLSIC